MKKFILYVLIVGLGVHHINAQPFLGLTGTDYTINTLRENPGYIVTNDNAQINLCQFGTTAGGNTLLFHHNIYSFLTKGNALPGVNYDKNLLSDDKIAWMNAEIGGPGFTYKFKERFYFGVTTGVRCLFNMDNLNNNVFQRLGANASADTFYNKNYQIKNFTLSEQIFKELNFSFGGNILKTDDYKLVGGMTIKMLLGVGAYGLNVPQASFHTYNRDGIAYNFNGNVTIATTPFANNFALTNDPFNAFKNTTNNFGAGMDLGLVYFLSKGSFFSHMKGYQLRIAASVTDIGSLSYPASNISGSYNINGKNIDYRNIQNTSKQTFGNRILNDYLMDTIARGTGNINNFYVGLPTAFRFNADINVTNNNFFLNANVLLNLRRVSANSFTNHYTNTYTLTPRYMIGEEGTVGIAMPFSRNDLNQGYLGCIIYWGSFYVGSASILNMLVANSFNNIDLFTGFCYRIKPIKYDINHMRINSMY